MENAENASEDARPDVACSAGLDRDEWKAPDEIRAGKRLALRKSDWLPDWFVSHSPRNSNECAEGSWDEWVTLARMILAHDHDRSGRPVAAPADRA